MCECRYYGKCAGACDGHGLCVSFRNVTYDCEDFEPMPDVKALKGLTEEMDAHAHACDYDGVGCIGANWLWTYSDRILEALGVG